MNDFIVQIINIYCSRVDRRFQGLSHSLPIRLVKGHAYIVGCRGFVEFVTDGISKPGWVREFLEWNNRTANPDETFFNTLNHNPDRGVPGAYLGTVHFSE